MAFDFRYARQTEIAECGLACLAIGAGLLGARLDMAALRRKHPVSARGLNLLEMAEVAASLDMTTRAVRCEPDELSQLSLPAVLHWGFNHFVVLEAVRGAKFRLIDPQDGPRTLTRAELSKHFTGVALELAAAPMFKKRQETSPLKLTSLFSWTPAIRNGLIQAMLLSLVLQAYVVASPLYMQLAVDEALLKGDHGLLATLAIGFAVFAAFNAGAEALRGVALQKVAALLNWDMARRLFRHMVRLPLPWFQRRKLADALTRFDSLNPVRALIANGLVGALIDGLLSIVTLVMMFIFAPSLTLVTIGALGVYIALRVLAIPMTMRLSAAALTASIAEQGVRIETLRAMQTIKSMAAESDRENVWANRLAETVTTNQSLALNSVAITTVQRLSDALSLILITYLGVKAAIRGDLTIGVLYAFMAYRTQFLARSQALFEQLVNWRLLDVHTHRLADIVLHPQETGIDRGGLGGVDIQGRLELKNVSFSYAPHEAPIFSNVDLLIESGEFVAIIGPSGAGKSTLLKVLCGLYPAVAGEVRLDGFPLASWPIKDVRRSLGTVMQDDELLSGTIAENVAFFDPQIDMDKVWDCLDRAALANEVRAMPMRADTIIGDMGSALSGGQRQRILIARALYRSPRMLVFDEATSHLDIANERVISDTLANLGVTRVVVAHRPETVARADRVFMLRDRRLSEVKTARPRPSPTEPG